MLSCAGTEHVHTPHMDALAAAGTRYTRAYVRFPLRVPSRTSMLTGHYPHEYAVHGNTNGAQPAQVRGPASLPRLMAEAGYECVYAGKWHAVQPSAAPADGFTVLKDFGDEGLVESVEQFLADRAEERPFFLVASFDDPHTICEVARSQPSYYGEMPQFPLSDCPNLPANFGSAPFEPEAVRVEAAASAKIYGTGGYGPEDWRRYRAAYAHLVQRVDARIGELIARVRARDEHTVVILTSDHGDGDAAHGWNQKTALWQEVIRVPFLIAHLGGQDRPGTVDGRLINTGLDLLPTVCDLAGAPIPPGLAGAPAHHSIRDHVVVETTFADGPRPHTHGRSVITERYKYTIYSWGRHREQLHDLRADPGEMVNLAVESRHEPVLEEMRRLLPQWCLDTDDEMMLKRLTLPRDTSDAVRKEIYAVPY